ncbi:MULTISPECIES: peptide-methionine (R)-S-oxide reductase MsrB [Marinomonas]|uniref:peptide-methionine (R)-S-oxide reductase n=1 Tax=Marinomonas arctica TaxID=383750 RepID=A0A7H1J2I4_9GAMM|nr:MULTISPECIES: peptide-methionine (R)-S-oxide reductase MsrB [Marinomonas]MCS7488622.1 methionine sulfoxide reductase B [Marinomonas sp. BSi20414]QNT04700.1 peptide-methionine (R)-S-oxide reductase MsrB [Marinomonas arctica]GGN39343.1 peptide-methionine (R)-S-oxide reductase [Marinomonas arctica]
MNRRHFIIQAACVVGVAKTFNVSASTMALASNATFEIVRTKKEWQAMLSDFEYQVMREEKTERAGSSPLLKEKREGTYLCKGCDLPLYPSHTKYESGTGWPSFYDSLPNAIGTKEDNGFFMTRTEVHCRRCGSHLGHIFDDGPAPTGLRHCLNGVSLVFQPA